MKHNDTYSLGYSLREKIISGNNYRTKLGVCFERILFEKTGIAVKSSYFEYQENQPSLFVYADISGSPILFEKSIFRKSNFDYYPIGGFDNTILECLSLAIDMVGLPALILPEKTYIIISDYVTTAINIYFNVNIADIQYKAQKSFPQISFRLAWRNAVSNQYYVIFENDYEKNNALHSEIATQIIALVSEYCKENDRLAIFQNEVLPIVTTVDELNKTAKMVSICRDNPHF